MQKHRHCSINNQLLNECASNAVAAPIHTPLSPCAIYLPCISRRPPGGPPTAALARSFSRYSSNSSVSSQPLCPAPACCGCCTHAQVFQGTAALELLFGTVGLGWAVNLMELPIISKLVDLLYEFLSANRISLGNALVSHQGGEGGEEAGGGPPKRLSVDACSPLLPCPPLSRRGDLGKIPSP